MNRESYPNVLECSTACQMWLKTRLMRWKVGASITMLRSISQQATSNPKNAEHPKDNALLRLKGWSSGPIGRLPCNTQTPLTAKVAPKAVSADSRTWHSILTVQSAHMQRAHCVTYLLTSTRRELSSLNQFRLAVSTIDITLFEPICGKKRSSALYM